MADKPQRNFTATNRWKFRLSFIFAFTFLVIGFLVFIGSAEADHYFEQYYKLCAQQKEACKNACPGYNYAGTPCWNACIIKEEECITQGSKRGHEALPPSPSPLPPEPQQPLPSRLPEIPLPERKSSLQEPLPEPTEPTAVITPSPDRTIQILEGGKKKFIFHKKAKVIFGQDIKEGDSIKAEETVTIFHPGFEDGKIVIRAGNEMKFLGENEVGLESDNGNYYFLLKPFKEVGERLQQKKEFRFKGKSLKGRVRGTEFIVNNYTYTFFGGTYVQVRDGVVEVSDLEGKRTVEVKAGKAISLDQGVELSKPHTVSSEELSSPWWEEGAGKSQKVPGSGVGIIEISIFTVVIVAGVIAVRFLLRWRKRRHA